MEIINEGFPKDNDVMCDQVSAIYYQNPDCTEDPDSEGQELRIETRDGGGGKFYNIKTEGWSFSDINELVLVINNFIKRVEYE